MHADRHRVSVQHGVRPLLNQRGATLESQTLRVLLEMRELILRGTFRPGERLREVPLSKRLNVSRTPLRLVLDRLAQEGLLKARPTGGFVASEKACVPLTFHVGTHSATVRFGLGKRCG